jgi:hypothetical protein
MRPSPSNIPLLSFEGFVSPWWQAGTNSANRPMLALMFSRLRRSTSLCDCLRYSYSVPAIGRKRDNRHRERIASTARPFGQHRGREAYRGWLVCCLRGAQRSSTTRCHGQCLARAMPTLLL